MTVATNLRPLPGMEGHAGTNLLLRVLVELIRRFSPNKLAWNNLGTIEDGMVLRVHGYGGVFEPHTYLVAEPLLGYQTVLVTDPTTPDAHTAPAHNLQNAEVGEHGLHGHGITDHGAHDHGPHTHTIQEGGILRRLAAGDRVLVAWASKDLPVVVARVNTVTAGVAYP